jgi:hypothetical protein
MGTDSRFFECGSNQIVFDWVGQRAINVTSGYRSCKNTEDVSRCDIGTGDLPGGTTDKHAEPGDFWVGTLSEVNDDLKCHVTDRDRWRTYWDSVLQDGAVSAPGCAMAVLPHRQGRFGPVGRPGLRRWMRGQAGLRLVDQSGRTVARGGDVPHRVTGRSLPAGVYLVIGSEGNRDTRFFFVKR